MADQNITALPVSTTPESSDQLLLVGATEEKLIDYDKLADAILNKLTSKKFSLDQGTMPLISALNQLNSKTLIITMSGLTDSTGNIRINVPNSFSRMPYVVTNVRDNLQCPYIVIISGWTQNEINFRIRNASDNSAIINTRLPVFQCMLIGK